MRRVIALMAVPPLIAAAAITIVPLQLSDLGASEAAIDAALLARSGPLRRLLHLRRQPRRRPRPPLAGGPRRPRLAIVALLAMALADAAFPVALAFVVAESLGLGFFWIPLMSLFTDRGEAIGMDPAAVALLPEPRDHRPASTPSAHPC